MDLKTYSAVELITAGEVKKGMDLLHEIIAENPFNASAWHAIATHSSDIAVKRQALETVLKLIPDYQQAQLDLLKLDQPADVHQAEPSNEEDTSQQVVSEVADPIQVQHADEQVYSAPDYVYSEYLDTESRIQDLELKHDSLEADLDTLAARTNYIESAVDEAVDTINDHAEIINNLSDMVKELSRYAHSHGPSDEALKEDIVVISDALSRILSIRGISFNWKTDHLKSTVQNRQREYGVIAQEVAPVFPELISTNRETGSLMVDYQGLVPVLIEAIRQQQEQINELRGTLNAQGLLLTDNRAVAK